MDDSGSWSETSSPDATLPSLGKKAKGKAPLPPGEARYSDGLPSFDSGDPGPYNMDQKEDIDRDIELKVVLPDDRVTSTIVNGSKPVMDLLVFLCGQYRLNPSTYTIELLSPDNSQLKFKPNTPIGMLEVERVILKTKNLDDRNKKPGPTMPEQTVRVVINYKKTQKTVMRVSPLVPLKDLILSICSKCDFDPQSTVLLQDYHSQKPLDLTKSLNDLGLRELYAMDQSKATSPTEFRLPPLQESCQNVEIKQHDDKGFFHFFRRSTKKKRDQTSSAPATPVLGNSRPPNIVRANTVTVSYDSNTLPSNVSKKRRAPLPPMHPSHNNANNVLRGQFRTSSCVVKSANGDESEKSVAGFDRPRTASFQHIATSDINSSSHRTKRKAPLPPSPPPNPALASEELMIESEVIDEPEVQDIETESRISLKEDENKPSKEETNGSFEERASASSAIEQCAESPQEIVASEIQNSSLAVHVENISKISPNDETATDGVSSLCAREEAATENTTLEYDKIGESENRTSTPTSELENHKVFENKAEANDQASQTLPPEQYTENTNVIFQNNSRIAQTETQIHENLRDSGTEKGKTQDSAVQTVNFDRDWEVTEEKALSHSQEINHLSTVNGISSNQQTLNGHNSQSMEQQVAVAGKEQSKQELVGNQKETVHTQTVEETALENSPSKPYPLFKQHPDPKPKLSNEITRDYLPKIGMTTYKVVPQRSFEVERYVEPEGPLDIHNIECTSENVHVTSHVLTNSTLPVNPISENQALVPEVKNSDHLPHGSVGYSISTMSKTVSEPSPRNHVSFSRSLSAAPVLNTEKSIAPEVKPKPKPTSPVKGPSSFYLQMQRRASSMYVTSAIAKTKASSNVPNTSTKVKDPGNEASQITMKTLPSRIVVENVPSTIKEKQLEDKSTLPERPYEVKNGNLGAISEVNSENLISASHLSTKSSAKSVQNERSSGVVPEHKKHVMFEETKQNDSEIKISELANTIPEVSFADKQVVRQENKPEIVSTTTFSEATRTSVSPTGLSAPLSFQKLRTFVTPRPFSSVLPVPFSSSHPSSVKRSQSFSSGISPTKPALNPDAPIGWSPVSSPVESKKESLIFSSSEEIPKDQTLTPELKNRVHSPPPVPAKNTSVSFSSPDPEELRQNILAAIRSGEAAASLKRITIRSSTISVNGSSRISHPTFSQSVPEE